MKQDIYIIRGTSNKFSVSVTDATGAPYVLAEGEKLIFGLKQKPTDDVCVLEKPLTGGADGVYTFELTPTDTANLACTRYLYDVGLQSGDKFFNIIEPSTFDVRPNVTKWGARA